MNGVIILSECVVRELPLAPMIVCLFMLALLVALVVFMDVLIFSDIGTWGFKLVAALFTVVVVLFVSCSLPEILSDYQNCYTEYKVVIDDSVNFNDFTDRYEILESGGGVYTVRERVYYIQMEGN